jgi:ribosomal protein S12 methylthiotransferase
MSPAIDIISLGCSKNLVDSERLIRQFEINGFRVNHDPQTITADIVVVNTCGFIADAKQESIDMILQCCQKKTDGQIKRLYVMGCLSERYFEELGQEIPEVDKFYGKFNWTELLNDLGKTYCKEREMERRITTPSHYAYLKIAEGCDRHCAFCAIPVITGAHKSRPIEQIVKEVEMLVGQGVREFQIIAQELTYYGIDLYGERRIAQLVRMIADVEGVEWIRLHYAYPKDFPFELLDVMNEKPNVCKYLDIALQHVSTNVLNNMNRHIDKEQTYKLVRTIREKVPGIHLRTTLMVGFPGEGEQEFQELMEFVRWAKFERMGAFAYSQEDGTPAERRFTDSVDEQTKQRRLSELMDIQQQISAEIQQQKVGTVLKVIIDRKEGDYYIGRTEFDSPEVDPEVLIKSENIPIQIGHFYNVRITDADEFDLYASLT